MFCWCNTPPLPQPLAARSHRWPRVPITTAAVNTQAGMHTEHTRCSLSAAAYSWACCGGAGDSCSTQPCTVLLALRPSQKRGRCGAAAKALMCATGDNWTAAKPFHSSCAMTQREAGKQVTTCATMLGQATTRVRPCMQMCHGIASPGASTATRPSLQALRAHTEALPRADALCSQQRTSYLTTAPLPAQYPEQWELPQWCRLVRAAGTYRPCQANLHTREQQYMKQCHSDTAVAPQDAPSSTRSSTQGAHTRTSRCKQGQSTQDGHTCAAHIAHIAQPLGGINGTQEPVTPPSHTTHTPWHNAGACSSFVVLALVFEVGRPAAAAAGSGLYTPQRCAATCLEAAAAPAGEGT